MVKAKAGRSAPVQPGPSLGTPGDSVLEELPDRPRCCSLQGRAGSEVDAETASPPEPEATGQAAARTRG